MNDSFRQKLKQKATLLGTIVTLPSPEIVEVLCRAGVDWIFVDLEHSTLSISDAQRLLQAAGADLPCLVRVPANEEVWIKKALDIGAAGIIVPQVQTVEAARQAVAYCKYPPDGIRSVGIARAHGYGADFAEYIASATDATAVVVQIEHIRAVDAIDDILAVDGIDCAFVGPYDLSASMGRIGEVACPEVLAAIARVTAAAQAAAMPLGIFGASAEAVAPYIQKGYALIAVGIDTQLIGTAATAIMNAVRARRTLK